MRRVNKIPTRVNIENSPVNTLRPAIPESHFFSESCLWVVDYIHTVLKYNTNISLRYKCSLFLPLLVRKRKQNLTTPVQAKLVISPAWDFRHRQPNFINNQMEEKAALCLVVKCEECIKASVKWDHGISTTIEEVPCDNAWARRGFCNTECKTTKPVASCVSRDEAFQKVCCHILGI
jgi:hypothetical protein